MQRIKGTPRPQGHLPPSLAGCQCDKFGTELCDHNTGECLCYPGVEGERCDRCMVDHWGFESGKPVREENVVVSWETAAP